MFIEILDILYLGAWTTLREEGGGGGEEEEEGEEGNPYPHMHTFNHLLPPSWAVSPAIPHLGGGLAGPD